MWLRGLWCKVVLAVETRTGAAEAEATAAQSGLSTGSGRGSVRARAWRTWELQAAAMTARVGWAGFG